MLLRYYPGLGVGHAHIHLDTPCWSWNQETDSDSSGILVTEDAHLVDLATQETTTFSSGERISSDNDDSDSETCLNSEEVSDRDCTDDEEYLGMEEMYGA